MNSPRAILFDVDGTLVDTSDLIVTSYQHTFSTHNLPALSSEKIRSLIGKSLQECYASMVPEHLNLIPELCLTHKAFQSEHLDLAKLFPNTHATLSQLKAIGVPMAACTARSKQLSSKTLERAGLLEFLDIVIYPEDVSSQKPHPESLIKALAHLKVSPDDAVMVGDSHVDIVAGKNAGTMTIRALYGINHEHLHDPEPDGTIDDIAQIIPLLQLG